MNENDTIEAALAIIESRLQTTETRIGDADSAKNYATLKFADRNAEVFAAMFLTNAHRVIEIREMFHGTIDGTSVYPREVVRAVIETNAAAIIFIHNHPSGNTEPSQADLRITERLTAALALIDVRVLDHLIVAGMEVTSLSERGHI